jgi:type IV pilus assembly protein PilW
MIGATAAVRRETRPGSAGFTLIELLIVLVLVGVTGATAINLFRVQNGAFRRENRVVEVEQNLRAGLDLMVRELRNAGMRDPLQVYGSSDTPGIAVAESTSIRFKQDFHSTADPNSGPDGDVFDTHEDIEYSYTPWDRTLRRRTRGSEGDSGAQPLAEYVTDFRFTYFDAAGDTIPFPITGPGLDSIRRIRINLTGAAAGLVGPAMLQTDVVPRNLSR